MNGPEPQFMMKLDSQSAHEGGRSNSAVTMTGSSFSVRLHTRRFEQSLLIRIFYRRGAPYVAIEHRDAERHEAAEPHRVFDGPLQLLLKLLDEADLGRFQLGVFEGMPTSATPPEGARCIVVEGPYEGDEDMPDWYLSWADRNGLSLALAESAKNSRSAAILRADELAKQFGVELFIEDRQ